MKPVKQEIVDAGTGDCLSAALASLLELPTSAVPKFRRDNPEPGAMMDAARAWLAAEYDLALVTIQMESAKAWENLTGDDLRLIGATAHTPVLAGGVSPNVPGAQHCVVGELDTFGMNFHMTHDPAPSGKGIVGRPLHLYFLVPLHPEKLRRTR
jgi:hypothetical protein